MRQSAAAIDQPFIQSEVEWRVLQVELRIAGAHLARFDPEELAIEFDAFADVPHVNRQMGL